MPRSEDEEDPQEAQFFNDAANRPDVGEEDEHSQGPFLQLLKTHITQLLKSQPDFKGNSTGSPSLWLDIQDPLLPGGDVTLRPYAAIIRCIRVCTWSPPRFFPEECNISHLSCPHCEKVGTVCPKGWSDLRVVCSKNGSHRYLLMGQAYRCNNCIPITEAEGEGSCWEPYRTADQAFPP